MHNTESLARDDERAGAATNAVSRVRARGATNRTGSPSPARRRPCSEPDDDRARRATVLTLTYTSRCVRTFDCVGFPASITAVVALNVGDARVDVRETVGSTVGSRGNAVSDARAAAAATAFGNQWSEHDATSLKQYKKNMQKITRKLGTEFRRFLLFRGGYGGFDDDASVSVHLTGKRGHFSAKTNRVVPDGGVQRQRRLSGNHVKQRGVRESVHVLTCCPRAKRDVRGGGGGGDQEKTRTTTNRRARGTNDVERETARAREEPRHTPVEKKDGRKECGAGYVERTWVGVQERRRSWTWGAAAAAAVAGCNSAADWSIKLRNFVGADSAGPPEHSRLVYHIRVFVYALVCARVCVCVCVCCVCVCARRSCACVSDRVFSFVESGRRRNVCPRACVCVRALALARESALCLCVHIFDYYYFFSIIFPPIDRFVYSGSSSSSNNNIVRRPRACRVHCFFADSVVCFRVVIQYGPPLLGESCEMTFRVVLNSP
ncbi:hypothetical protein AGLY_002947 [Aphis glycines]|uniref:Uncharacterized protein n=1 Tax=Aphis glycines TaxID=307491 RepID=A0A6G0U487_APHGL|nr:hypothetical protein AGLY_002947 [Aphis glycines]